MPKSGAVAFAGSREGRCGSQEQGPGNASALQCHTVPSLPQLALDSFVVLSHYPLILETAKDERLPSQTINANKSTELPEPRLLLAVLLPFPGMTPHAEMPVP